MSAFLGPVHFWLYEKIRRLERIELGLRELSQPDSEMYLNRPLEDVVDTSRIHQSLQDMIRVTETRFAKVLDATLAEKGKDFVEAVFTRQGRHDGATARQSAGSIDLAGIHRLLNDYLLDGMPCDTINNIETQEEDRLVWHVPDALHAPHWEVSGLDVNRFYEMKRCYVNAFINAFDETFHYDYTESEGMMIHTITGGITT